MSLISIKFVFVDHVLRYVRFDSNVYPSSHDQCNSVKIPLRRTLIDLELSSFREQFNTTKTGTIRFNLHSLVFLLKETVFEIGSLRIQKRNLGPIDAMIITIRKTNLSVLQYVVYKYIGVLCKMISWKWSQAAERYQFREGSKNFDILTTERQKGSD